jgi:hypothetical protein
MDFPARSTQGFSLADIGTRLANYKSTLIWMEGLSVAGQPFGFSKR